LEFDVQNSFLGIEVGKESFNTEILVPKKQRSEEFDERMEELQERIKDHISEFAKKNEH